jgi:hypothetical protein
MRQDRGGGLFPAALPQAIAARARGGLYKQQPDGRPE